MEGLSVYTVGKRQELSNFLHRISNGYSTMQNLRFSQQHPKPWLTFNGVLSKKTEHFGYSTTIHKW